MTPRHRDERATQGGTYKYLIIFDDSEPEHHTNPAHVKPDRRRPFNELLATYGRR